MAREGGSEKEGLIAAKYDGGEEERWGGGTVTMVDGI